MLLPLLTALAMGGCVATLTLWVTRWGAQPVIGAERLSRLKGAEDTAGNPLASLLALRKRVSGVRMGGVNLVSLDIAQRWSQDLERAGLTLTVREFFIVRATAMLVLVALGMLLSPLPLLGLIGVPIGFLGTGLWLKMRVKARQRKLESQLVELLQMLASGLRAGFGLMQALESASQQLPAPISIELRRTMRDTAMGASVEKALTSLNDRIGSNDWDITITAILIQRSVGGNLAEILDGVATTMREREHIKGEIRTLTAQQRMTGYVIGGIPIGLGLVFMMINPDFMSLLFTESLGRLMLAAGVVLWGIGFAVIQKIVNIEV